MTVDGGTEALQKLLDDGWLYHDKESDRLARELEGAAAADFGTGFLVPFVHLSTHTIGSISGIGRVRSDWASVFSTAELPRSKRPTRGEGCRWLPFSPEI